MKRAALPPEMVQFFSAYMDPADLTDAQLGASIVHPSMLEFACLPGPSARLISPR